MLSKKARSKAAREKINDVDRAFAKDFWSRIPTNLNLEDPIQHRAWQALGKPAVLPEDFHANLTTSPPWMTCSPTTAGAGGARGRERWVGCEG